MTAAFRYTLAGLLAFGALNAFGGGIYGMSGAEGVPIEWLANSPFTTYSVPSLILFVVVGGSLLTAAIAVLWRWRRARMMAVGAATIVLGWLAIQLSIIGYVSWMQPVTAIGAVVVLALAWRSTAPITSHCAEGCPIKEAAARFLAERRIAVTGVSRKPQGHGSNIVYQRLRQRGYLVFPVNPNAEQVEGDRCYHDLRSIPGGVTAVVIATRPELAEATMRECADLGIKQVWMHRSFGTGSVSDRATSFGRQHGITVIDGGCPCMFEPTADPGHKMMRTLLTITGKVPRRVAPT